MSANKLLNFKLIRPSEAYLPSGILQKNSQSRPPHYSRKPPTDLVAFWKALYTMLVKLLPLGGYNE
jgi:hypothetical protein